MAKLRDEKKLKEVALKLRRDIIEMIYRAGSGHPGGSLSAVEIVSALYLGEMNYDPKNPKRRTATGSSSRRDTAVRCSTRRWRTSGSFRGSASGRCGNSIRRSRATPACSRCPRSRCHREPGPGDQRRQRDGARGEARQERHSRLLRDGRRGMPGGRVVGSGDDRGGAQARQPVRIRLITTTSNRRNRSRRSRTWSPWRRSGGRSTGTRSRSKEQLPGDLPRARPGPHHQGQAHRDHRQHQKGKGVSFMEGDRPSTAKRPTRRNTSRPWPNWAWTCREERNMSEKIATRDAYGRCCWRWGKVPGPRGAGRGPLGLDPDRVVRAEIPGAVLRHGIAEQDMVNVGRVCALREAGGVFELRDFREPGVEQIRNTPPAHAFASCSRSRTPPVRGEDGASAQANEDVAIFRAIPEMKVIVPADATETKKPCRGVLEHLDGPVYMRFTRAKVR